MEQITNPILQECASYFVSMRKNLILGAELLYKIREEELWKGTYNNFSEYIVDEIKMDTGRISKILSSYEHFVVKNGIVPAQMVDATEENLYLATKMTGSAEEQLAKALTLTRSELRQQTAYEKNGEEHSCNFKCTVCGKSPQ